MRESDAQVLDDLLDRLRPALERWYRGDPYGYAALFADDLSYFDPRTERSLEDLEGLRSHYGPIEGLVQVPRTRIVNPRLQRRGDLAILTYNVHEHDGEGPPSARWNATEVYERSVDGWRVIHAHWSSLAARDG